VNIVALGRATGSILRENYRSVLAAGNMIYALDRQDRGVLLAVGGDHESGIREFRDNEAAFLEWLGRAKDNITIPGERTVVEAIESGYAEYRSSLPELIDLQTRGLAPGPDWQHYRTSMHDASAKVRDACLRLHDLNEATMYAASAHASHVAGRAIWSTTLVAFSSLLAALMFSQAFAERMTRPLRRFVSASRRISSGDYVVQVPVEGGKELRHLAREFNEMATKLRHYQQMNIGQIIAEQEKGEAILSSIEDGLIVFDPGLNVTTMNPAARHLLHLESDGRTGLTCEDVLRTPSACELVRQTVAQGVQPEMPDEARVIAVPGKRGTRQYLMSATAVRGRVQGLHGVVVLLRDITRLREVERLKSDFIMAASHELRTPLTGLAMSIDLLLERERENSTNGDRELLRVAHEEVHRMQALVNDLLDLSRIEAGKIEMEFERVSASSLFHRVQGIFRGQVETKAVELTATVAPDLPDIRADATKITWVLTNLISNALRYVNQGGRITLSAELIGRHVHVVVRDDGPGIPVEYQMRIFEKFVQVEGREGGGTGLGLAICKEIIRAHGGTIWVDSTPGQGSTFTFTVPVAA
jgi:NtrC-family two-component system sensor histidine kinase KinB